MIRTTLWLIYYLGTEIRKILAEPSILIKHWYIQLSYDQFNWKLRIPALFLVKNPEISDFCEHSLKKTILLEISFLGNFWKHIFDGIYQEFKKKCEKMFFEGVFVGLIFITKITGHSCICFIKTKINDVLCLKFWTYDKL